MYARATMNNENYNDNNIIITIITILINDFRLLQNLLLDWSG